MSTAQPIALPSSSNEDIHMSSGSYSSFQAASFTRRYMDSPASWKASSFGSRFYPGMSPGQLLGPLDPNEFEFGKLSSSIESDKGSIVNALNVFEREDELCRDYTCCGLHLTDLHALLEHFEECHVVVVDPYTQTSAPTQGASYYANPLTSMSYQGSFDPDDIKLDFDNTSTPSSSASSPPDTPVSTPQSAYPSVSYSSSPPSPRAAPISAFETTTVLPSRSGQSVCFPPGICAMNNVAPTHDVFNAYAGYSDYSSLMPGTAPSPSRPSASSSEDFGSADHRSYAPRSGCVTPALLLNSSANTPDSKPVSSRVASPAPALSMYPAQTTAPSATMASANTSTAAGQTPRASTMLSRPATSLLLSKPFRCLKPNCNKSYKQANGLKYHMTHGSCNFALPKDLEHLQVLLASKRSQKAEGGGEPISDAELREVEKEAERRLRPYACGVGDCQRRYKNMNGLRYHCQHSGDHGAIGLALLASGQHECLQNSRNSRTSSPAMASSSSMSSAAISHTAHTHAPSPLSTPTPTQAQMSTNYVPATALPPSYQAVLMVPPAYNLHQHSQQATNARPIGTLQMSSYMLGMSR